MKKMVENSLRVVRNDLSEDSEENILALRSENDILSVQWFDSKIVLYTLEEKFPSENTQFKEYIIHVVKDQDEIPISSNRKYIGTLVEPFTGKIVYHFFYEVFDETVSDTSKIQGRDSTGVRKGASGLYMRPDMDSKKN